MLVPDFADALVDDRVHQPARDPMRLARSLATCDMSARVRAT